jgi:hypothetical protein
MPPMSMSVVRGSSPLLRSYPGMSGFPDTMPVAIGTLAIGESSGRQALVWIGFMAIGRVVPGMVATGVADILMAMNGVTDIATAMVAGLKEAGINHPEGKTVTTDL